MGAIIEHSENRLTRQSELLKNEVGPEVLQSNVQQTCILQEYQT